MVENVLPSLPGIPEVRPSFLSFLIVPFLLRILVPPCLFLLLFLFKHCLAVASHMETFLAIFVALLQVQRFWTHFWVEFSTLGTITTISSLVAIVQKLWTGQGVLEGAKSCPPERLPARQAEITVTFPQIGADLVFSGQIASSSLKLKTFLTI